MSRASDPSLQEAIKNMRDFISKRLRSAANCVNDMDFSQAAKEIEFAVSSLNALIHLQTQSAKR